MPPTYSDGLKDMVSFSTLNVSLAVLTPVARISFSPLFLAQFLVKPIIWASVHLMSLLGRLFGPLTFYILTGRLILVPWAWIKKITAIDTLYLLHNHFLPV